MAKEQLNLRVSDLTRRQLEELGLRWGTTQTETITVIIDRALREELGMNTWINYATNMQRRYPTGHRFITTIDRGDDNPHSQETVTVTGYFDDPVQHESGVIVQTDDGMTAEISYAYLREDGSGH